MKIEEIKYPITDDLSLTDRIWINAQRKGYSDAISDIWEPIDPAKNYDEWIFRDDKAWAYLDGLGGMIIELGYTHCLSEKIVLLPLAQSQ